MPQPVHNVVLYVALHTSRSALTVSQWLREQRIAICTAPQTVAQQQQLWKIQDADSRYSYIRSYQWKRRDDVATHFRPFRTLDSVMRAPSVLYIPVCGISISWGPAHHKLQHIHRAFLWFHIFFLLSTIRCRSLVTRTDAYPEPTLAWQFRCN